MQLKQINIGFIGGGNMAQALINGLLESEVPPAHIMVSDPNEQVRTLLAAKGVQTTTDAKQLIAFADTVVLAIKPQLFSAVLSPLAGQFNNTLIISVAAGMSVAIIAHLTQHNNIVRTMPNTPALIQAGATGLYATDEVSQAGKQIANDILSAAGLVVWVNDEAQIHAVTAVSGSAPAYFFYVMEAMIAAAQQLGLNQEQAKQLTLQTAFGAAKMALSGDDSPATLRQKVTSPNGTTHAAIESMQANHLDQVIAAGMQACAARSEALAEEVASTLSEQQTSA